MLYHASMKICFIFINYHYQCAIVVVIIHLDFVTSSKYERDRLCHRSLSVWSSLVKGEKELSTALLSACHQINFTCIHSLFQQDDSFYCF